MVFKDDFYKSEKTLDVLIHAFWAHEIKKKSSFFFVPFEQICQILKDR